jgi:hypothetical protein
MHPAPLRFVLLGFLLLWVSACSAPPRYEYRFVPGKTATLRQGKAESPRSAPTEVRAAIAAGNALVGQPYVYGGGHGKICSGYDCSGATSHVLRATGKLAGVLSSHEFRHYGESGPGRWISIYVRKGHVFLVVAGLRYDTGWSGRATGRDEGPHWTMVNRPAKGCEIRHPPGL